MAVEMFLKIDGVTGGSRNYHHKGWADVLSWSWALDHAGDAATAVAKGSTSMNAISLCKAVGMESPTIMKLFAEGKPVKSAEISVVPLVGKRDAQQKYVSITLEDVSIKSISTGGSTEESAFKENITLVFGKIKFEYHQYADAGPDGGAQTLNTYTFGWDVAANAAC